MRHTTANDESLRSSQEKLVKALQMVFDLLEEYAPQWYTKEHHDIASEALATANEGLQPSSIRPARKRPMAA